jgi:hypothetical protein
MIPLVFSMPNVFAAAHFAACMVVGGALVCAFLIVIAYLLRGAN